MTKPLSRPLLRRAVPICLIALIAPAPGQERIRRERHTFTQAVTPTAWRQARPERRYDAEIGYITVPEVRSDPGSRSIEIAYIKVPSRSASPGPPTFIFSGGPGGSAIREAEWYVHLIPDLLDLGDVVGIDQRGVGRSIPNLNAEFSRDVLPLDQPTDPERILQAHRELATEARDHWAARGVNLAGYATAEAADDVDAVRRALGYDTINLLGFSYGSHLALSVVRRHPEHVSRLVVKGVEGPNHTFKTPAQIQEGLENVARAVERHPDLGEDVPDFLALVGRVLERVADGDVVAAFSAEDGRQFLIPITSFDVRVWLANAIGRKESLESVPRMLAAMERGDFSELAPRIVRFYRRITIGSTLGLIADCASGMTGERARRIREQASRTLLGDIANFPFPQICESWAYPDLGDSFRGPLRSDVPALFLAGDLDSRTPIANAREVMRGFPNGTLVVVRNAGHDSRLFESDGTVRAISRFLRGETIEEHEVRLPPIAFDPVRSDSGAADLR